MDDDRLDDLWRRERDDAGSNVSREVLLEMLRRRADDARARMRRRLRTEIVSYLVVLAIALPSLLYEVHANWLVAAAGLTVAVGSVMATLRIGARRLATVTMDGSTGDALRRVLAIVDTTLRAYLVAYVLCIALGVAVATGLVIRRHPSEPSVLIPVFLCAAIVVAWGYRSGRSYLRRRFGRLRDELAGCLAQLESGT